MVVTTQQLKEKYSNLSDPIKVLENEDIETLCKIKGIRENSAKQLIKKYNGDLGYAEAISLLKKYDMTDNQIKGLVDKFGSGQTIENKIKKNPYFLLNLSTAPVFLCFP